MSRLCQQSFMAEFDLPSIIDIEHDHINRIPDAERRILIVRDALVRNFRNMAEPFFAENFDEKVKGDDRTDASSDRFFLSLLPQ